jgi:hypothetical protein
MDRSIVLAKPVVDAATTRENVTSIQTSMTTCLLLRPHDTMPPKLGVFDAVDVTMLYLLTPRTSCFSKTMPSKGRTVSSIDNVI